MRIGSLFSGAGGLDMAVESVFGGEVVWQSEVDKAASAVLAHRWPNVPNLGDITAVDWDAVAPVDVLCGGFPCQDVSAAGKRAGIKHGTRSGLWSVFADVIDHLRPTWVVIENVRGLLSARAHRGVEPTNGAVGDGSDGPVLRAAGAVLGDLADLGYDAQWATVAAADVGAPHRRERVFILASRAVSYAGHDAGCPKQRVKHQEQTGGPGESSCGVTPDARGDGCGGCAECDLKPPAELAAPQRDDADRRVLADGRDLGCVNACAADTESNGRHEGRPESARIVGGFDVAVSGDEPGVALLPTPCAGDGEGGRQYGRNGTQINLKGIARVLAGDTSGLPDCSELTALLPTPRASDPSGAHSRSSAGFRPQLGEVVRDFAQPDKIVSTKDDGAVTVLPGDDGGDDAVIVAADRDGVAVDVGGSEKSHNTVVAPELAGTKQYLLPAWGKYEPAIRRWEHLTRPAPAPTEPNKNGNPRLSAAFSEWLMGWPTGWVTAIGISRNDQLRIIGNGVCPQQAVAALRFLLTVSEVAA